MRNVSRLSAILRTYGAAWKARAATLAYMVKRAPTVIRETWASEPMLSYSGASEGAVGLFVDGTFAMAQRLALLAYSLPEIGVNLTDWHLSVEVGKRQRGFTVGPHFLSYDRDNDIQIQIVAPGDYQAPTSELGVEWSTHHGLTHLFIPQVRLDGGVVVVGNQGDISIPPFNELPFSERPTLIPEA